METDRIRQLAGVGAAPGAEGAVVVIDVLRACTNVAHALAAGARDVVLVADAAESFAWRARDPQVFLSGESGGVKIPGFDLGNSPEEMERAPVAGRRVVLRSSSGTQGVVQATAAERILLGSFPVAAATVAWLERHAAGCVSLLAMGSPYGPDGDEDVACADYLRARLAGPPPDPAPYLRRVRESAAGRQALDPCAPWITPGDLERATELDRFDFAVLVERRPEGLVARAGVRRA